MDEPLGALDLKLREAMQAEISAIQHKLKITTVYVTHDQSEAMSMSDRIAVMNDGRIEQLGSAVDIYNRPASRFVAAFVGQINLIAGTADGGALLAGGQRIRAPAALPSAGQVTLGIRPEQLHIVEPGQIVDDAFDALDGVVRSTLFAGSVIKVEVDAGLAAPLTVETHPDARPVAAGERVRVTWRVASTSILSN